MKVGFISLGCSKNLVDSEKIMGMLQANGHTLVHSPSEAEARRSIGTETLSPRISGIAQYVQ